MRRVAIAALAVAAAGCGIRFESASQVLDRRVLAIAAEPPELVLGSGPLPAGVQLRALVADPSGAAEARYAWSACLPGLGDTGNVKAGAGTDPNSGRCLPDETSLFASGTGALDALDAVAPVPPALELLLAPAVARNVPLSLYLQVQLELDSPAGPLFALKRLVVSPPLPAGRIPNRNPYLAELRLGGETWMPGKPKVLERGRCEPADRQQVVDPADPDHFTVSCAHKLEPLLDEAQAEAYRVQTFDGQVLDLKERLIFDWFTDHGSFSAGTTAQNLPFGPQATDPLSTRWREPPGYSGLVRVWVVVRDGRGGTGWAERQLDLR